MVQESAMFPLPICNRNFFDTLNSYEEGKPYPFFTFYSALSHAGLGYECQLEQVNCSITNTESVGCIVIELIDRFQDTFDKLKKTIEERLQLFSDKFIGVFTDLSPKMIYVCFKI